MEFFNSAIEVLQTLVVALGAGLGVWGAINLLEGYGLSLIHISEPTRHLRISYAVFCLKKKNLRSL